MVLQIQRPNLAFRKQPIWRGRDMVYITLFCKLFCVYSRFTIHLQAFHFCLMRATTNHWTNQTLFMPEHPHLNNLLIPHHPSLPWQWSTARTAWLAAIFMSHNTATPDGRQGKLLPPELLLIQFYQSTSSWERRTIWCFSQLTHASNQHIITIPAHFLLGGEKRGELAHGFPMRFFSSLFSSIRPVSR